MFGKIGKLFKKVASKMVTSASFWLIYEPKSPKDL